MRCTTPVRGVAMFGSFARQAPLYSLTFSFAAALSASACLDRPLCGDCAPETVNVFTARVPTAPVNKIDLLFMIDGSASMGDKQELLRQAVPSLLSRFTNPLCVDEAGNRTGEQSQRGVCKSGSPEFPPLEDMHIGVISSNLGAGGSDECDEEDRFTDDKAWLLPRAREKAMLNSYDGSGFLAWDPGGTRNVPPGTSDPARLSNDFADMVTAVEEKGCGFEASLESWYRFLIDPDPPAEVIQQNGVTVAIGTDTALLEQRARFLRADSLVAIVMLTDENDCSLRLAEDTWMVTQRHHPAPPRPPFHLPRPTAACATNPNDVCCRSCGSRETAPPAAQCKPLAEDPGCQLPPYTEEEDPVGLRCFDQKRRFGVDFLMPVERYVRGLTQRTVMDRHGVERENPLFASRAGAMVRDPERVFLAGIVGVPWQSIATPDSLSGPGLRYLTAEELTQENRWDLILGDPATGRLPTDPHMIESVSPRSGSHPFVPGGAIAPVGTSSPDPISGHEQVARAGTDLQYACIFEREPLDCTQAGVDCDCSPSDPTRVDRPLCQPPGGGPGGTTQYYAKAYPGLRHLQVLKGLGKQGVVASICPKVVRSNNPGADPSFGYNPALDALVGSLARELSNQCLARAPAVDDGGRLRCVVVEAELDGSCDCARPGRSAARSEVMSALERDLTEASVCDPSTGCTGLCACELAEHQNAALEQCRTNQDPTDQAPGYCYIDPAAGLGDPALVRDCPGSKKRLLRFVGPDTPAPGSFAYMACMGEKVSGG